ncbi:serine protease 1-like [Drosophila montana]|uniref:serine protease 1-like n=1 Tax=Drosophila montana TaxID=40370 RepID=UPI00313ECF62
MKIVLAILCLAFASSSGTKLPIGPQGLPRIPLKDLPNFYGIEGRIINGFAPAEGKVPYIVGLSFEFRYYGWWCGGSIIGNTWILTAAHCAERAESVRIYYGSNKLEQAQLTHDVSSGDILPHAEYYRGIDLKNDIALIRTPHVKFTDHIKKLELGERGNSYAGRWSTACGWGKTGIYNGQPNYLQCVNLKIISTDECSQQIGPLGVPTEGILYVSTAAGKSSCNGDSGGPLVTHDGLKLVGINSFVLKSCQSGLPGGFTRVSDYRDWIRDNAGIE